MIQPCACIKYNCTYDTTSHTWRSSMRHFGLLVFLVAFQGRQSRMLNSKVWSKPTSNTNLSYWNGNDTIFINLFLGYVIPRGCNVFLHYKSVHLDPLLYEDPEHFNPWRWLVSPFTCNHIKKKFLWIKSPYFT